MCGGYSYYFICGCRDTSRQPLLNRCNPECGTSSIVKIFSKAKCSTHTANAITPSAPSASTSTSPSAEIGDLIDFTDPEPGAGTAASDKKRKLDLGPQTDVKSQDRQTPAPKRAKKGKAPSPIDNKNVSKMVIERKHSGNPESQRKSRTQGVMLKTALTNGMKLRRGQMAEVLARSFGSLDD